MPGPWFSAAVCRVPPLLQAEVVPTGWLVTTHFWQATAPHKPSPARYSLLPVYLGESLMNQAPSGGLGGLICLTLYAIVPAGRGCVAILECLRRNTRTHAALSGINAAVARLLLAALYHPVWTSAVHAPEDFRALALVALVALMFWKLPPWFVVVGSGIAAVLSTTVL